MKKVKIYKNKRRKYKWRQKDKKFNNIFKKIIYLLFLIIILIFLRMKTKNIEIEKEEENYNPELISYKGEKVQKKKLVEDFLSRSSESGIEKYNEKNRLL